VENSRITLTTLPSLLQGRVVEDQVGFDIKKAGILLPTLLFFKKL